MSPILSARGGMSAGAYGWGVLSGGASASFESIATITGNSTNNTVSFTSIPSTFKHLQIRGTARSDAAATIVSLYARPNNDTAANYAWHQLAGDGSTGYANGSASVGEIFAGNPIAANSTANRIATVIIDILDYTSTSKYKTLRIFAGHDLNGSGRVQIISGLWMSTNAITSFDLTASNGFLTNQASFALYGIKESA